MTTKILSVLSEKMRHRKFLYIQEAPERGHSRLLPASMNKLGIRGSYKNLKNTTRPSIKEVMRYGYIYKTKNLINNRIYIGKKKGVFDPGYLGSGVALTNAIEKYGRDNFKVTLLVRVDNRYYLNSMEKRAIKWYRNRFGNKMLYNIADGGDGGAIRFGPHSLASIEKMRKPKSEEAKRHMRKPKSEEHKNNIRKSRLGAVGYFTGKHHSAESRNKISVSNKGRKFTEEHRNNLIKAATGVKRGHYKTRILTHKEG